MALQFLLFPAEIRNQIYRYILLHNEGCIRLKRNWGESFYRSRKTLPDETGRESEQQGFFCMSDDASLSELFPAILATCHQIYNEASNILYGENVFLWNIKTIDSFFRKSNQPVVDHAIERIRWLRVEVEETQDRDWHLPTPEQFFDGLERLTKLNCSLQGFLLNLFHPTYRGDFHDHTRQSPFLWHLAQHDAQFASAVAPLDVPHRIDVRLEDTAETDSERQVARLVQAIETKGWRSCVEERIHRTRSLHQHPYCAETLRPTLRGPSPKVRESNFYSEE